MPSAGTACIMVAIAAITILWRFNHGFNQTRYDQLSAGKEEKTRAITAHTLRNIKQNVRTMFCGKCFPQHFGVEIPQSIDMIHKWAQDLSHEEFVFLRNKFTDNESTSSCFCGQRQKSHCLSSSTASTACTRGVDLAGTTRMVVCQNLATFDSSVSSKQCRTIYFPLIVMGLRVLEAVAKCSLRFGRQLGRMPINPATILVSINFFGFCGIL